MNKDHIIGAGGAVFGVTQLADIIMFYTHVPTQIATDEASVALVLGAMIAALVQRFLNRKGSPHAA